MIFTEQFQLFVFDWRCGPGQISRLIRLRSRFLVTLSDCIIKSRGVRPSDPQQVQRVREFAIFIGYTGPVFVNDQPGEVQL